MIWIGTVYDVTTELLLNYVNTEFCLIGKITIEWFSNEVTTVLLLYDITTQ